MIRSPLRLHTPDSLEEAAALLQRSATGVLGGGTVLVPLLSRGERDLDHVVDLQGLGLDAIQLEQDELAIGARVTYTQLAASATCARHAPLVAEVAAGITGDAQLRNQATLAGSACYANPASDAPAMLVALDARLRTHGSDGPREIPAAAFFQGAFSTALAASEFVTHIVVPRQPGPHVYEKVKLCEGSWPIVTAAAVRAGADRVGITLGGVCTSPAHISDVASPDELADHVIDALTDPWSDELAPAAYRCAIAPRLARRVLARLWKGETA